MRVRGERLDDPRVRLRVEVADTGIGIAPRGARPAVPVVLPGGQLDPRSYGGTGLGLAISKRSSSRWAGRIGVDSEPGARVDVLVRARLPLGADPRGRAAGQRPERAAGADRGGRPSLGRGLVRQPAAGACAWRPPTAPTRWRACGRPRRATPTTSASRLADAGDGRARARAPIGADPARRHPAADAVLLGRRGDGPGRPRRRHRRRT